ncbi:MAG: transglutaminase-like domain-containing protein, partial [Candidatus Cloacimonetes bacterium]|nr:transglutaminase-like domain-containing protein [Candidatus Cloacimonadota bacterium]
MQRLLIISMILILFAVLLSGQITSDVEDHYQILRGKAVENLGTLPIEKGNELFELLNEFPDVIMAFFLAYEESSKLLLANPQDLVSHHYRVRQLWEEYKDKYSLPFFLSYIAKITVTDERITPYRDLFEEYGLYQLKQHYPNKRDLVIELNLWTRRFMTFKPTSGRDMAPYDILKRSNIGRCEEMQIFFISAARSVGIPARPAMTPLWAHTDNNHAWVEVFVDGKWSYLGAVEPAYEIDYAWFSASAAKAIMIMATAAFPAE